MLDRPLTEGLLKIRNLNDFKGFRDWLDKKEKELNNSLRDLNEDTPIRLAQGKARFLKELKDLIETSQEVLERNKQ